MTIDPMTKRMQEDGMSKIQALIPRARKKQKKVECPDLTIASGDPSVKCPRTPSHTRIRAFRIKGKTADYICSDCGTQWQGAAHDVEDLESFCLRLAKNFDQTERAEIDGESAVLVPDAVAKEISESLRSLAKRK